MLSWLINGMMDSILKYFNHPMTSVVTRHYVPSLPFPVVTLCNYNQWKKSTIDNESASLLQQLFNPIPVSYTENNASISPDWEAYDAAIGINEWNLTEFALNKSHQANDMIQVCTWRTAEPCGPVNFTQVITDLGVCYSFNHHSSPRMALEVHQPGSQNGLFLRLNVEQHEYTYSDNTAAGIKVCINGAQLAKMKKYIPYMSLTQGRSSCL